MDGIDRAHQRDFDDAFPVGRIEIPERKASLPGSNRCGTYEVIHGVFTGNSDKGIVIRNINTAADHRVRKVVCQGIEGRLRNVDRDDFSPGFDEGFSDCSTNAVAGSGNGCDLVG